MADLRFHPWNEPLLPAAADTLLREFRRQYVVDLAETLVVLPGSRAGRRLLEILVERASEAGLLLAPPARLLTVGALPEELYRSPLPVAPGAAVRAAWARALAEAPPGLVQGLFGRAALEGGLAGRMSLGQMLASLNRTVGAAGLTFAEVAHACRGGSLYSDEERWMSLSWLQERTSALLHGAGLVDREEARRLALARAEVVAPRTVVLVGVAELPRVVRRMLERVSGSVLSLIHGPREMEAGFDELGAIRKEWWQDRALPLESGALSICDRPSDQADEVVRRLGALDRTYGPDEVTVGVPDPTVVPLLAQRLRAHGLSSRYAEGSPLTAAAPVRLLGAVAEYLAQGRFPSLASLVRHPDLPAQLLPSRAPALADEYFETHLPARLPRGRLAGEAGEDGLAELRKILDGPDFLGPLQGRRPLPEWMPRLLDFLIQVYGGAPLRPARPRDRAVLEALLRVREGAEALGRVPGPLVEMCAAPDAIQALLGELRDVRVPPEGEGESIELVGWLELHLDDAPVLILTGMNEPFLPESVNADPFLPNALRGRLGLEDNQARLARDVYRLTAILRSRPGTRLITGRRDASGDPLRPSRLLLTGDADTVAATLLRFAETEDPGRRSSSRLASGIRPPPASAFRLPPRERIALPQIPQPLSVTAFAPILRDPYGWVLEHVLRLRESCDDQQELDALAFGSLAHTVLERFAHTAEAESSDPVRVRTRLGRILDSVVKDLFGPSPLPAVPVQVEQLRARLGAFAAWQAGWVAQGWRIHAAEARTPKGGSPLDVDGRPVLLAGRVDRIDRNLVTGAWMVMDYKTGEGGADPGRARSRDGRWTDLQLPLYAFLLGDLCHRDGTPLAPPGPQASVGLAYLPISGGPGPVQLMVAEWTPADLDSALEAAREVIRGLRSRREVVFDPWVSGAAARGALAALLGVGLLDEEDSGE